MKDTLFARLGLASLAAAALAPLSTPAAPQTLQGVAARTGSGGAPAAGGPLETIDFEAFVAGEIVSQATGSGGSGPVAVFGSNPGLSSGNVAIAFDSANPTGGDFDLGTPNGHFGGPGVGAGGQSGSPYANTVPRGMLLIVAENLVDGNGDGVIDDPDDADVRDASLELDFSALGTVRAQSLTIIDVEAKRGTAFAELLGPGGAVLATVPFPSVGDNGVAAISLGGVSGVARLVVHFHGSGAIDDVVFARECSGTIGDRVWNDLDNDGLQDAGEGGIAGVTVNLTDAGGAVIATTATDEAGAYAFTGLCAGTYGVVVDESTLPPDFERSPCNAGSDPTADSDCSPATVVLPANDSTDDSVDFGYGVVRLGSIGNFVWFDADCDGVQGVGVGPNAEPGMGGVTVILRDDMGALVGTRVTDDEGRYRFDDLPAGTYVVSLDMSSLPADVEPSPCNVGFDDTVDNDCSPVTVTLSAGLTGVEIRTDIDFGFGPAGCTCQTPNRRSAGSLLLFPEFDNRPGAETVVTVTNVGDDDACVEFIYIDGDTCLEFNRTTCLTPHDTFTTYTYTHNPGQSRGFLYVFAKQSGSGIAPPVVYNGLVGQQLVLDGYGPSQYSVNAVAFRGVGEPGALTDVDMDGHRDLNGLEYEEAPGEILVPRFLGQTPTIQSDLILIGLSGGMAFTTTVDLLIYNDNEVAFSRSYDFHCWERAPLIEISEAFANSFLRDSSDHDPTEVFGMPGQEAGWIRIDGGVAQSFWKAILDPAVYAVLVERSGGVGEQAQSGASGAVGDLPWELCTQDNGTLLPLSIHGDNED